MPLPVESSPEWAMLPVSNGLPAFSFVGCWTRQLFVTSGGGAKVIQQCVVAAEVVSDGIQVIPGPYFQVLWQFRGEVGSDSIVAAHGDGG